MLFNHLSHSCLLHYRKLEVLNLISGYSDSIVSGIEVVKVTVVIVESKTADQFLQFFGKTVRISRQVLVEKCTNLTLTFRMDRGQM